MTESDPRLDPRLLEARQEVGDLMRRFSVPRAYAGDYYGDFAERVIDTMIELGWSPPLA